MTKYLVAVPLKNQDTESIAKAFVENIILKFGCPLEILTDNGSAFCSELLKKLCKFLQIKKIHTTAYHPQSNGSLERSHRVLKEYLRNYISPNLNDWDKYLPFAVFAYNSTPNSNTKFSPFELYFGSKPNTPSSMNKNPDVIYNYDDYYFELKNKLQTMQKMARQNLIESKNESKKYYDKYTNELVLNFGDKVLIENVTKNWNRGIMDRMKLWTLFQMLTQKFALKIKTK